MGVAYHAHARFLDPQDHRITVPAPVDPDTPNVAWWYDWIAMNAAALRRAGFTAILYPPFARRYPAISTPATVTASLISTM
jgi:hypothetical protein